MHGLVKTNAFLHELYHCVVTKRELFNTAKLSVFKSVFAPMLTYGHESWVRTKRVLFQIQAAEMGCLRRVHGVGHFVTKCAGVKFVKP